MFGRRPQTSGSITVIAAGSVVEGTLRVRGLVQVDGTIDGMLIAEGHVSVGPEGKILGQVTADELSVGGEVQGTVCARGHLHVLSKGKVRGDVRYATLEVERGGVMDGNASRMDDKLEVVADGAELLGNAAAE